MDEITLNEVNASISLIKKIMNSTYEDLLLSAKEKNLEDCKDSIEAINHHDLYLRILNGIKLRIHEKFQIPT